MVENNENHQNGKLLNGHSITNGSLTNSYIQTEYVKDYKACYSNGVNNGYVTQNGKKTD